MNKIRLSGGAKQNHNRLRISQKMTQLVSSFIFLVLVHVTISSETPEDSFGCGRKNALKTDCATNCELDKCPVNEHYSRECDRQRCAPGCQCRFNEKFHENGTCIPTQQCPPFRCDNHPNQKYEACPSYCTDSCSQGICPILMVVECFPECRCKEGFRRKAGICVPYEEC